MITHYIKVAVRHILKYKTRLSVGILCFSICLYCSRYIYDTNKCFDNYERIADINLQKPQGIFFSGTSASVIDELRQRSLDEVEAYTFVVDTRERKYNVEVSEGKELPYELNAMEVDSLFLRVFTPQVLQGSWEVASQTPNAVVLTRSYAEKMFPKGENPIGKRMILMQRLSTAPSTTPRTGGIAYTVQAVIEDIPINTSFSFLEKIDMLTLNDSEGYFQSPHREQFATGYGFALLRPTYKVADLRTRILGMNMKYHLDREDHTVTANPMGKIFMQKSVAPYFAGLTLLLGVLILLTGLLNFFQFLIGTYLNRRREYGIRKVAGCNTLQLFIQLSVQAAIISSIAFLITFCLIELLSPSLHFSIYTLSISIEKNLLMTQATEYMVAILLLGMLLSLLTAWRVRKVTVQAGMNGFTARGSKHRVRNTLLGVQFFICFLFVTGTAGLYLQAMKTSNTLFNTLNRQEKNDILSFPMDYQFMKNEEKIALIDRVARHSGITDKMMADISYLNGISGIGMRLHQEKPGEVGVNIMRVPKNFFDFMHIPILAGRVFETDADMVCDQALEAFMKKEMLGTALYDWEGAHTICGVCADLVTTTHSRREEGYVFLPSNFNDYVGHCYIKCAPGKGTEVKAHVENTLREALPESVEVKVNTLMEDIIEEQALEHKLKDIILFFSIVSLIITLLGVYSAITLDTERRQKEVAIRKVNGAGMKQIVMLFARLYIKLLLVSAAIALPLGYAVTVGMKQIYTVFFDNGPLFWCGIFGFVAAVTTLTVLFRILKIARINPAEVIKSE